MFRIIRNLLIALPEYLGILLDLFGILAVHFRSDLRVIVPSVFGTSVDELLKVPSVPVAKTLFAQLGLLSLLCLGKRFGLVDLLLVE